MSISIRKKKGTRKIKKESFVQSILVLMISQVMIKVLGLVYKLYLTNKEGFGDIGNAIYNSGFQIYALLLAISSTGVPNAISKLISERLAKGDSKGVNKVFRTAFIFFAIIGGIGSLILFFGASYISDVWLQIPESKLTLMALSPAVFFVSIASVIRGYFNGYQRMKITANSQTLEQVAKTFSTILIVEAISIFFTNNVVIIAAAANLATTLSIIISFAYLYKYYKFRKRDMVGEEKQTCEEESYANKTTKEIIKAIIAISIPISISSLVSAINKSIDSVTAVRGLKTFLPDTVAKYQFGIYTGKIDILVGLPLSFNVAFATVLVPSIAKFIAKRENENAKKAINFSMLATILIGLPCTIGMIIFAKPILELLFPNASEGAFLLQITSITIILMMLAQTIGGVLQGIGKYKTPAVALACGVVAKLILNIILIPIPSIGINGVAISSIVCHLISFGIVFIVLKRETKVKFPFKTFVIKPIVATGIMGVLSYMIYYFGTKIMPENIATIIAMGMALIIYAIAVLVLKILNKEDIYRLPMGEKIYAFLEKSKIYRN